MEDGRLLLGPRSAERRTYPNCRDILGGCALDAMALPEHRDLFQMAAQIVS